MSWVRFSIRTTITRCGMGPDILIHSVKQRKSCFTAVFCGAVVLIWSSRPIRGEARLSHHKRKKQSF